MDRYEVESEYQCRRQEIRVLLPDSFDWHKKYAVVYVLPVEAGFDSRFGYGLGEIEMAGAHNIYDAIFVQMGFEKEPWYGDHPENPKIRQAGYLKDFLVPFVEDRYSTLEGPAGRLLLGFSKSGWGAFSLILKYPDFFGFAAAWDSPMLLRDFRGFPGMQEVYGTLDRLSEFRPELLIPAMKQYFQTRTRLVLAGERIWGKYIPAPGGGSHTVETHELLEKHGLKHECIGNLSSPHQWDSDWMIPVLNSLMKISQS